MPRMLTALAVAFAVLAFPIGAVANEAVAQKLAGHLPSAPDGWTSQGPQTQTIEKGEAKGAMAFQVYQEPQEKKSVLIRLVENTPPQFKKAVDNPQGFNLKPAKIGQRKAAVRDNEKGGTLIVLAGARLAMIEWRGGASRADAMGYADALDLDSLEQLN